MVLTPCSGLAVPSLGQVHASFGSFPALMQAAFLWDAYSEGLRKLWWRWEVRNREKGGPWWFEWTELDRWRGELNETGLAYEGTGRIGRCRNDPQAAFGVAP